MFIKTNSGGHDAHTGKHCTPSHPPDAGATLAAAVFGLIDLLSLHDRPVRKTALAHMAINLTVVALYAVNTWIRLGDRAAPNAIWLSLVAILLLVVSGWLGGKMVYTAGVAVDTESLLPQQRH